MQIDASIAAVCVHPGCAGSTLSGFDVTTQHLVYVLTDGSIHLADPSGTSATPLNSLGFNLKIPAQEGDTIPMYWGPSFIGRASSHCQVIPCPSGFVVCFDEYRLRFNYLASKGWYIDDANDWFEHPQNGTVSPVESLGSHLTRYYGSYVDPWTLRELFVARRSNGDLDVMEYDADTGVETSVSTIETGVSLHSYGVISKHNASTTLFLWAEDDGVVRRYSLRQDSGDLEMSSFVLPDWVVEESGNRVRMQPDGAGGVLFTNSGTVLRCSGDANDTDPIVLLSSDNLLVEYEQSITPEEETPMSACGNGSYLSVVSYIGEYSATGTYVCRIYDMDATRCLWVRVYDGAPGEVLLTEGYAGDVATIFPGWSTPPEIGLGPGRSV